MAIEGVSTYPSALDTGLNDVPDDETGTALGSSGGSPRDHDTLHADTGAAVMAVQSELGTDPSGASATVAARITAAESATTAHISDATAAHAASAISYGGGTGMSATDVEAAIDELATEKSDTSHTHADKVLLQHWFQENVVGTQTNAVLSLNLTNARTEIPMVRAGSVTGIVVLSSAARSGGTLTVEATINGTGTGLTAVLDGTNTTVKATTQATALDTFVAGDRIGAKITTASWTPTTADISVEVEVST